MLLHRREEPGHLRGCGSSSGQMIDFASDALMKSASDVVGLAAIAAVWLNRHATTVERITSEALANVEQHAKAQRVFIRAFHVAISETSFLIVEISDDGCGFDP